MKQVLIEYQIYLPNGDVKSLKTTIPILNLSKGEIFEYNDTQYIIDEVITSCKNLEHDFEILIKYQLSLPIFV
jgi:hypothetical protein